VSIQRVARNLIGSAAHELVQLERADLTEPIAAAIVKKSGGLQLAPVFLRQRLTNVFSASLESIVTMILDRLSLTSLLDLALAVCG